MATMGLARSASAVPVARHRARAAIWVRPWVVPWERERRIARAPGRSSRAGWHAPPAALTGGGSGLRPEPAGALLLRRVFDYADRAALTLARSTVHPLPARHPEAPMRIALLGAGRIGALHA